MANLKSNTSSLQEILEKVIALPEAGDVPQPILQSKTVTPAMSAQTVEPDSGYDGLSRVLISGDPDLIASNIKRGVNIFGVLGALAAGGVALDGISAIEVGTFTLATSASGKMVNHSMGVSPNFAAYVALDDITEAATVHSMFVFKNGKSSSEKTTNSLYDPSLGEIKVGSQELTGISTASFVNFPVGSGVAFLAGVTYMYIFAKIDNMV